MPDPHAELIALLESWTWAHTDTCPCSTCTIRNRLRSGEIVCVPGEPGEPMEAAVSIEPVVDTRTPQQLREAGVPYCPKCYTFGHQHRKDCPFFDRGMNHHVRVGK